MINTRERTILVLKDNYPGCHPDCEFVGDLLRARGYFVREINVAEFLGMSCMIGFKSELLIIPGSRGLPISTVDKLSEFVSSAGSVIFIGGPLYYDLVEEEKGEFVTKPLENQLDAAMNGGKFIREGICPSYKTFDAKRITRLKGVPGRFGGELKLTEEINVTIPCETGTNFIGNKARFIPLVECYSEPENEPLKRGFRGGRRGAFAFIELEKTQGVGYQGKFDYGLVENTAVGSAVAMIGARCGLGNIAGIDELLVSVVDKLHDGIYFMSGGADGICYRKGERVRLGAEIMNTTRRFREVICRIKVGGKVFEREILLSPRSVKRVDVAELPEAVDGEVKVELIEAGRVADSIISPIALEIPVEVDDPGKFVRVEGKKFVLGNKRWYMAGINYWSTYSPAREKSDYWRGMFDLANYDPVVVDGDLEFAAEIGLNCLLTRVDFTDLDLVIHGLRDFLWRCERYGLRVWLACRVYCSRFYDERAVRRLFELVHIRNNPTVMALDLEWESAGDLWNGAIKRDFVDEWNCWLHEKFTNEQINELGLAENAFGFDFPTERTLLNAKLMRHFAADSIDSAWERVSPAIRKYIPNQLLTFRTGRACPDSRSQAGKFIDFSALETYDLAAFGELSDAERNEKAVARIVCLTKIEQFENCGKPVVWAEYGCSVCGTKWAKQLIYDHEGQKYREEQIESQKIYNSTMENAMFEADVAGSAPWWWCGGFRYTEMADFGYLTPDGLMNESGRDYISFCERMKKRAVDERPTVVVRGNVDEYLTKDEFVKKVCVPAALGAGKDVQIAVETEYEDI